VLAFGHVKQGNSLIAQPVTKSTPKRTARQMARMSVAEAARRAAAAAEKLGKRMVRIRYA